MDKGLPFRQKCVPKADVFIVRRLATGGQQTGRTNKCKVTRHFVVTSETLQHKQNNSLNSGKTEEEEAHQVDSIVQKLNSNRQQIHSKQTQMQWTLKK